MEELKFDTVFHLAGEQIIPNYMALKLMDSPHNILVTTNRTSGQYKRLTAVLGWKAPDFLHKEVSAYDYVATHGVLDECLKESRQILGENARIAFNVTGGTKPMFAAALDVCRANSVTPVYFDTQEKKIRFFDDEYSTLDMPRVFTAIDEFIALAGYTITDPGKVPGDLLSIPCRRALRSFWTARGRVNAAAGFFADAIPGYNKKKNRDVSKREAEDYYQNGCDELYRIAMSNTKFGDLEESWRGLFPSFSVDASRFGGGGWLEAWMLQRLADSKRADEFRDLRTSVRIRPSDAIDQSKDHQELDVVFTDGYGLTILECKSGRIPQEAYQKLEKIVRDLGGSFGRGIICSATEITDAQSRDRLSYSRLSCVADRALETLDKDIDQLRPGKYYSKPMQ